MKAIAFAAALVLAAGTASAGNVAPVVEDAPPLVVEPEAPAAAGSSPLVWLIPIVAVVAIALAASD